jgi:hypothetical protein
MTLMAIRAEGAVRAGLDGTGYQIGRTGGQAAAGPGWAQGTGERADPTEARQWARAQASR